MAKKYEISTVLTLSTSHITAKDNEKLLRGDDPPAGVWFNLKYQVCDAGAGFLIHVCEDKTEDYDVELGLLLTAGWSKAILNIQALAQKLKCEYIRLDPDGLVSDELETFEW
jgi:hypothetical protein